LAQQIALARHQKGLLVVNEKDLEIAKELKRRLSRSVDLVAFKVFGSRARGDSDEYSDMDVFVEVETIDRPAKERILDIA